VPDLASFAPVLAGLANDAIAVSRPFAVAGTGPSLVALAVRFAEEPRRPGGWIIAALPADALLGAFTVASPAPDAKMAVFRSDGVRLAGSIVEHPLNDEARLAQQLATAPGLQTRRFRDGSERLVSLNSLPRYGLQLMLTRDLAAVLVSWREASRLAVAALALILGILAASVHLVQRADRRHALAQQALESQRARASKLEALGTLAGGVAHDFNNVLAAIIGFGEICLEAVPPGGDQARRLEKLLQAALRGRSLVERILAFSRGGARASTVFELEPVVAEVLTLLTASLRPGIVLERGLEAHGARLRGDPTQAFEAVMNLCTNAMEAMPAGGTLSVQLERVRIATPRVLSHTQVAPGDYLALSVADQGLGIRPEVMEHLFEPFFTTRAARSGTGLGLAVVHGVVAEFGGAIDVQSRLGKGSRFTLYFPECAEAIGAPEPAPAAVRAGAAQTLLVVDDDPTLVTLAEEMLTGLGYQPVGFTDPAAALRALQMGPRRFAAIITDEVMPGLSGTQLTEAARTHAPHIPVLLVSGYGGAQLAARAAAVGVTRVLAKPLRRTDLARALGELLR
jgi:signal transduction histidine kinase